MTYRLPSAHPTPKLYRVRATRIWEQDWLATSREEAIDKMVRYLVDEVPDETSGRVTAKVTRDATPEETAEYYGDADEPEDDDDDMPFPL